MSVLKMLEMGRKGHQIYLCSIAKVEEPPRLEDIPVVRDYPGVFPEELPSIPPVRDVEFSIGLIPGTAPISKPPIKWCLSS